MPPLPSFFGSCVVMYSGHCCSFLSLVCFFFVLFFWFLFNVALYQHLHLVVCVFCVFLLSLLLLVSFFLCPLHVAALYFFCVCWYSNQTANINDTCEMEVSFLRAHLLELLLLIRNPSSQPDNLDISSVARGGYSSSMYAWRRRRRTEVGKTRIRSTWLLFWCIVLCTRPRCM